MSTSNLAPPPCGRVGKAHACANTRNFLALSWPVPLARCTFSGVSLSSPPLSRPGCSCEYRTVAMHSGHPPLVSALAERIDSCSTWLTTLIVVTVENVDSSDGKETAGVLSLFTRVVKRVFQCHRMRHVKASMHSTPSGKYKTLVHRFPMEPSKSKPSQKGEGIGLTR